MVRIHAGEKVDGSGKSIKRSREEITDSVARTIIREETDEREALTAKLKAARLAREAESPAPRPVKRSAKRKTPLKRY